MVNKRNWSEAINRDNSPYLYLYLLTVSITFYLSSITQISPVYIFNIVGILIFAFGKIRSKKLRFESDSIIAFFLMVYLILFNLEYLYSGEFINLLFGLLSYQIIRSDRNRLSANSWIRLARVMVIISTISLSIDSTYRLLNPSEISDFVAANEQFWFYRYKTNSFMFQDSNTTGLIALILLSFVYTLEAKVAPGFFSKKVRAILVLLIIFSFSRSAIFSLLLLISVIYISKKRISSTMLTLIISIALSTFVVFIYYFVTQSLDPSTYQKLQVFNDAFSQLQDADVYDLTFGFGASQAVPLLGKHPHNLFVSYIFELGLLGLILFVLFLSVFIRRFGFIFLMPILLCAMSFFTYLGSPYLFVPMALLANSLQSSRIEHKESR